MNAPPAEQLSRGRFPLASILRWVGVVTAACVLQLSPAPVRSDAGVAKSGRPLGECVHGDPIDFAKVIGKAVVMVTAFTTDHRQGWLNYDGSNRWFAHTKSSDIRLVLGVSIIPFKDGATLARAASGEYNSHYHDAAEALVKNGHTDAVIRVGWEFNGGWYPWGYSAPGQDKPNYCTNYKAAFRNVVQEFRAVSPLFKFDWNPAIGDHYMQPDVEACYPGDDVVDTIGLDVYDTKYSKIADPVARFKHDTMERQFGLKWHARFAAEHHKPMSYPEWGVGSVGDNPYMIQAMHDWFALNDVGYQCYWNSDAGSGYDGNLAHYPQQLEKFKEVFGLQKP